MNSSGEDGQPAELAGWRSIGSGGPFHLRCAAPPGGSLPQSPYSSRRKLKASTSKYSGNNDSSKASRA